MSRPGAILRDGAAERQPVLSPATNLAQARAGENFPVGSRLIARPLRPAVLAFYAVARGADDVADSPSLAPAEKLARLDRMDAGLSGEVGGAPEGLALRAALARVGREGAETQASRLLDAFRFDVRGGIIETWGDLTSYCESSANPVGRFLLDLHGEGPGGQSASDALCTALQVLNHLQDLREDHLGLSRRYLPGRWMEEEGAPDSDLGGTALSPALRRVVDRALAECDALLRAAAPLAGRLRSRRLGGEAAAIHRLACGLASRLRHADPLAGPVKPSHLDFALAGAAGAWRVVAPRAWPRP